MLVEVTKCPNCGGCFDLRAADCSYCGFGLIYKVDEEKAVKKQIEKEAIRPKITTVKKRHVAVHKNEEVVYRGCPICFKKFLNDNPLCKHYEEEPVMLYWRNYLAMDENEAFSLRTPPMIKDELRSDELYDIDGWMNNGVFIVSKIRRVGE